MPILSKHFHTIFVKFHIRFVQLKPSAVMYVSVHMLRHNIHIIYRKLIIYYSYKQSQIYTCINQTNEVQLSKLLTQSVVPVVCGIVFL